MNSRQRKKRRAKIIKLLNSKIVKAEEDHKKMLDKEFEEYTKENEGRELW